MAQTTIPEYERKEKDQVFNSKDTQFEEMLIECIRNNDDKKFMDALGPTKSGDAQLKSESYRRMSMFTNITAQSIVSKSSM